MFYTVDGTLLEEHGITGLEVSSFKHKFGYGGNDNSIRSIRLRNRLRTPTTSDNELWCNYFQHCSQYVEDYSLFSSKPHWDEINWPSRGNVCNNGLDIGTKVLTGEDLMLMMTESYPMNQHPIQGGKLQQSRHTLPMPHLDLKMELIVVMIIMGNPYPMRHHTNHTPS